VLPLCVCGLLGGVAMAPWLLKNVALVGAPFYPFLTDRVAEPWLDALFPGGSAVAAVGPGALRFLRAVQEPFNVWDPFFAPSSLNVEVEGAHYFTNRAFLLLPLGLLFLRKELFTWLVIPAVAYVALALTLDVPNLRYLVPAAPALTLAVSWILLEVRGRWIPGRVGEVGILLVCGLALFPTGRTMAVWNGRTAALRHAVGAASAHEYLLTHRDPGARAYFPVVRYLNRTLSGENRILMLFEARGFPVEPQTLQDNKISNWPILAAVREGGGCLERAGFDHVLVALDTFRYYQTRGLENEGLRWDDFQSYREACLEEVWQSPGYVLFRLRASTEP
ncbi:hypothetical protein ACFL0I_02190, partial [Gemmatimonadota bacterium]